MIIPQNNRVAIYETLFRDGVLVALKDFNRPKHPDFKNVPNLQVIKAMQSLKSRGYVKENFAWKHYYWYLTNEGITYLRDYLHLPPEIVPSTLRKAVSKPETSRPIPKGMDGGSRPGGPDSSDRDAYRRGPPGGEPKGGPGTDFKPEFRGGFGRGRGGFGTPQ